ncbi:MAG: SRPBCC family protein [Dermatophilaceae bacterium]
MKISGTAVLNAPVDQVWAAFNDPAVLARTIPGCQELRAVGPDAYKMTVTAGVASIKGTYEGDLRVTEQSPPGSFVLKAAGAGAPGTVGADVKVSLLESATGGTDLSYDADAVVGGVIGGVGQRMLTGVAKKMAGQFFAAVDADIADIAGVRVPAAVTEAALVPAGAPGTQITYAGPSAGGRPALQGNGFQGRDFLYGTLVGAAIALAGVAVGIAAGRR